MVFPDPYKLPYVELIAAVDEVNRCPGGKRTISDIVLRSHVPPGARILEIGSNTGFTSIEVARILDCSIVGIDVSESAVAKATQALQQEPDFIRARVQFMVASAANMPFPADHFDLIIAGGANAFISEDKRNDAIREYWRVLRPYGFVSVTSLFYQRPVPPDLLSRLSTILGFTVKPWTQYYWLEHLLRPGWELYHYEERLLRERPKDLVSRYVDAVVSGSPALQACPEQVRSAYRRRWEEVMQTFNENHRYLAFMLVLLRKSLRDEQEELFLEAGTLDPWHIADKPRLWEWNEED